jgi:Arylsulfotransferase (ASST)
MFKDPNAHIRRVGVACGLAGTVLLATAAVALGAFTTKGAWSFVSAPQLHPPKLRTIAPTAKKGLAGGDFLVTNSAGNPKLKMVGGGGPLILDSHLQPIWALPPISANLAAGNLKEQSYNGKPALSWWEGTVSGHGITTSGEDFVVDNTYRTVATLKGADGWLISEHDMVIAGHDAWVTAYKQIPMNLTKYGGSANGILFDAAVQEYDLSVRGGKLLYTWDALQHIPLSDSYQVPPKSGPWDAYHENSIQLVSDNRFLVSMRQEWAAYLVSATTGGIEWTLGGKHSSFKFGKGAQFEWQHDVELHKNQVSIYDDHCCGFTAAGNVILPNGPSRALVLNLNTTKHTATAALSIARNRGFDSTFLGNSELLPNGNVLVSWGSTPYFSEYSKTGKLLMDVSWPGNASAISNESYRAYLENWSATPYYPPNGAVRTSKGKATVYASWDGATGVAAWRVLGGSSSSHLAVVARKTNRTGFETAINLSKAYSSYEVEALNSKGKVIGTSKAFPVKSGGGGGQFYNGGQFY